MLGADRPVLVKIWPGGRFCGSYANVQKNVRQPRTDLGAHAAACSRRPAAAERPRRGHRGAAARSVAVRAGRTDCYCVLRVELISI